MIDIKECTSLEESIRRLARISAKYAALMDSQLSADARCVVLALLWRDAIRRYPEVCGSLQAAQAFFIVVCAEDDKIDEYMDEGWKNKAFD